MLRHHSRRLSPENSLSPSFIFSYKPLHFSGRQSLRESENRSLTVDRDNGRYDRLQESPSLQAPREATPLPYPLRHRRRPIVLHRNPRPRRGYKNHRCRPPPQRLPRPAPTSPPPSRRRSFLELLLRCVRSVQPSVESDRPDAGELIRGGAGDAAGVGREGGRKRAVSEDGDAGAGKGGREGDGGTEHAGDKRGRVGKRRRGRAKRRRGGGGGRGEIRAEMRNGVLKVVVPKVNDEERKDVLQVQIE